MIFANSKYVIVLENIQLILHTKINLIIIKIASSKFANNKFTNAVKNINGNNFIKLIIVFFISILVSNMNPKLVNAIIPINT